MKQVKNAFFLLESSFVRWPQSDSNSQSDSARPLLLLSRLVEYSKTKVENGKVEKLQQQQHEHQGQKLKLKLAIDGCLQRRLL